MPIPQYPNTLLRHLRHSLFPAQKPQPIHDVLQLSVGWGTTPDTYRYTSSSHNDGVRPRFRRDEVYAFRITSYGQTGLTEGRIRIVRGVVAVNVEVVVEFDAFAWPCYLVLPVTVVDLAFVQNSGALSILNHAPTWSFDHPWKGAHLFDNELIREINIEQYPTIFAYNQSVPVDQETWTGWTLHKSSVRLGVGLVFNLVDADGDYYMAACKIVGVRAVELNWVEFSCYVCPSDITHCNCQYFHFSAPVTSTTFSNTFLDTYEELKAILPSAFHESTVILPLPSLLSSLDS